MTAKSSKSLRDTRIASGSFSAALMKLGAVKFYYRMLLNTLFLFLPLAATGQVSDAVSSLNPNVLPESIYPYWPGYKHLETSDLGKIKAQPWIGKEHTVKGWDWSLPNHVEPSPKSLVGLQRIIGLDKDFVPLDLKFKANGLGLLWVKWRDIEAEEGVYDFSKVLGRIKQANEAGLDVSLRILTSSKARGNGAKAIASGDAPLWLEDRGVTLLPRKPGKENHNFDPAHPEFHKRYLKLIDEVAKAGIPNLVKAAYVGYASHSLGDEGIGPFKESEAEKNDALPHVRERLNAFGKAFAGMEHKVYMGGSSHYGYAKGFGVRRGFVEMYLYNIPNEDLGQSIDTAGYLCVDEKAPVIVHRAFNGEVNEEYEHAWATAERGYRFGATTNSFPYRYFTSTLRALQMRCTYIHTTGHLVPGMLPFLSLELARTVDDTPDVWTFLRTSYMSAERYKNMDVLNRPISANEKSEGLPIKNFERWLFQRDADGFETRPAMKIQHPIKMWMVEDDKYFDYIARAGKQIGFNLDPRWPGLKGAMAIKITYLDAKPGAMQLIHNGGSSVRELPLTGDGQLKTTTFILSNLAVRSMDHGFDFILRSGTNTEELVVSMVRVVAM
jgi:hypothetical protein